VTLANSLKDFFVTGSKNALIQKQGPPISSLYRKTSLVKVVVYDMKSLY
jgi:hypothetical protein